MGLLKAGVGALAGVLADSWRDYFYCDALDADTLAVKGAKRESKRSSNKRGDDNIISNGSIVAVNDGQCMIIVDQGKVVEVCAEPGEFVYDTSTEPSLFYGNLKETIKATFEQLGKRFTFGGEPAKDQRVYYFNTKEIVGNKYGTPSPVPFRVVDRNIGLDVDIAIRCHGEYSYKLTDPILFYTNVCGNISDAYKRDAIDSQLKTELLTALQPAFAKISEMGVRYSALPAHTAEISQTLNEILSKEWRERRGIEVAVFGISSVNASEEDEKMIKEIQRNAALRDPSMAAAHLTGAQAQAMQDAAKNEGGMGAMGGFFGMNMANNAAGSQAANLFAMGQQQQQQSAPAAGGWKCECGTENTGKFCSNCGKPQPTSWKCECGAENTGKFCSNCGKPRPEGFTCAKCGYTGTGAAPKFCPNCGNAF